MTDTDPMEIPDFLRREGPTKRTTEPTKDERRYRPIEIDIEFPKWGNWEEHWVHSMDELHRIGSGYRRVYATVGHKWVHVMSEDGYDRQRIKLSVWKHLVRPGPTSFVSS